MKFVSVFCGSSEGNDPVYKQQAYALGKALSLRGYGLVYGGACIGLMGAVANGVLDNNGTAIGVIPSFLDRKELVHTGLTENYIVANMHERKAKMFDLSHATIALPGGYGTVEELFEILTWGQLNLHKKPVGLLNVGGFYDALIEMIDRMVDSHFLKADYRDMLLVDSDIEGLLHKMVNYVPPVNEKWFEVK